MDFTEQRAGRKRSLRKRIATAAASLFVVAWAAVFGQSYVDANIGGSGGDGGNSEHEDGSPAIVIGGDGFGPIVLGGGDSSSGEDDDEDSSGFSIGSSPSPAPVTSSQS